MQKQLPEARQRAIAVFLELATLRPPYLVDGRAQILRYVKIVVNELRLRNVIHGAGHEGRPPVQGHRFDRCQVLESQRFSERIAGDDRMFKSNPQHPRAVDVGHHRDGTLAFCKAFLIDPDVWNQLSFTAIQATLDGRFHNPMRRVLREAQQLGCP